MSTAGNVAAMGVPRPSFTVGVEEEYLLVDRSTRDLAVDPPPSLWEEAAAALEERVTHELLRAQIEVSTQPHPTVSDLAADLRRLRATVSQIAGRHDLAIIASSTHPFALWWEQRTTDKDRYLDLAEDLAIAARRMVICGMHVHVAIEDPDLRVDLMNQVVYFLPHLLALSCSSPFWGGRDTGFRSYRINVFRSLPRTGLPEEFSSWTEYLRHIQVLVDAGLIDDATKVWWDVRPSARYPTLEMRVADICTRWEDAVTVAALYLAILHMLYRLRTNNQRWRRYSNFLVAENLWRAQRYGVEGSLMDYGRSQLVPFADLVDELCELVRPDAEELGCLAEVERARVIAREGTSARRQVETYRRALEEGADEREALRAVVDELIADTVAGI
ncbi:MAG: putative glutamate--cysteine ligase 2 [Acidimicrobiia bacterium]|nr:MAG: putative glutamate--cysteine ligase 2 [Acidimicrobiia bacterium]